MILKSGHSFGTSNRNSESGHDLELAFLSASHSASTGMLLSDESISLASALQFVGFQSVVGSLWEMYDADAPGLTHDFYDKLSESGELTLRRRNVQSARALHYAVRRMRKMGKSVDRWAMFVHIGAY
jgi:CHAT domain-containing protein